MDKLLKHHTIDEMAKKTHISPITLEKLLNKDFDKLERVKLKGFVKILENEFPDTDFSDLKEAIKEYEKKPLQEEKVAETKKEESKTNFKVYILVVVLLLAIGYLFVFLQNSTKKTTTHKPIIETNKTEKNSSVEINQTLIKLHDENVINTQNLEIETNDTEVNDTQPYIEVNNTLVIEPLEKVWFKVTYLNTNKSKEYLTSHKVELNATGGVYIKFGHGLVKILYHDREVLPNSKKITRVIIKDDDINITKKRLKEFK